MSVARVSIIVIEFKSYISIFSDILTHVYVYYFFSLKMYNFLANSEMSR